MLSFFKCASIYVNVCRVRKTCFCDIFSVSTLLSILKRASPPSSSPSEKLLSLSLNSSLWDESGNGRPGVSSWIGEGWFLDNLPSIQGLRPEFKHLAHGRKSLHLAFLTLQGKQAASALDLVAIRRALARSMSSAFIFFLSNRHRKQPKTNSTKSYNN